MRRAPHRQSLPPSRALRLAVVLLALLQIIAPIWHVCALSGHAMPAVAGGTTSHHSDPAARNRTENDGPRRPLICWCAPREDHQPNPDGPKFSPVASHEHDTCLALLLQTMPNALAVALTIGTSSILVEAPFLIQHESAPFVATLSRFRGRAPPIMA